MLVVRHQATPTPSVEARPYGIAPGPRGAVADPDGAEFTMEESEDGQRISATWRGTVVDRSCGREIRGQREGGWDGKLPFVLKRLP